LNADHQQVEPEVERCDRRDRRRARGGGWPSHLGAGARQVLVAAAAEWAPVLRLERLRELAVRLRRADRRAAEGDAGEPDDDRRQKDSKRFPSSGGWGYAQFDYDPKTDTFTPNKEGTPDCGNRCHKAVAAQDYIFHPYQKR